MSDAKVDLRGAGFGNFTIIAAINLWDQSIENPMLSSSLCCQIAVSLLTQLGRL